ncbi:MAG: lipopolysaccharide biosynthesis protein [Acidobacteriota bacterium]
MGVYIPIRNERILKLFTVFRLQPFDQSTSEGRSMERYRRVVLTALTSLSAKGITALTMLASVPLTVDYLGAERYGMWMAISSLIAVFSFADLGIGNGLVNSIAEANGRDDRAAAISYVSNAFFMLLGIALLVVFVFLSIYPFVAWPQIFKVQSELAVRELGPSILLLLFSFALSIPLSLVERIRIGYQEGFVNSLWQTIGSVSGLVLVLVAIRLEAGLPWLVVAMAGAPVVAMAGNALQQFYWRRPWLRPRLARVDRSTLVSLSNIGSRFLIIQILTAAGLASDNLIIARVYGAAEVTGYAVVQKLYSLALLPQFLVAPLWPAFGEALTRREYEWARQALRRGILLSVTLAALIAIPLFFFGQFIVGRWAGGGLVPPLILLGGFTCQMILGAYGGAMTAFLNSTEVLHRQVIFYGLASLTAILLKILLAVSWQIAGVTWATVLAYGCFYAIPAWVLAKRVLRGS